VSFDRFGYDVDALWSRVQRPQDGTRSYRGEMRCATAVWRILRHIYAIVQQHGRRQYLEITPFLGLNLLHIQPDTL
jgi:hypothetical protein